MIFQIMRFEINYGVKSIPHLVMFFAIAGLCFLLTANGGEFQATAVGGEVFANAPAKITYIMIGLSVFCTFLVPSFISNALLKDMEHQFDVIIFSTPIEKFSYFFGRFAGGFVLLVLTISAAPIGLIVGTWWPWVDASTLGPIGLGEYWLVFFSIMTTSMFVISAILYVVTALTRNIIYVYLAAMAILLIYILGSEFNAIPALFDPFMHEIFEKQSQYWTAYELNSQSIIFDSAVIGNRLMWISIALVSLIMAYQRFTLSPSVKKQKIIDHAADESAYNLEHSKIETAMYIPQWSTQTNWSQLWQRIKFEVMLVVKGKPFMVLMLLSIVMLVMALTTRDTLYGVDSHPLTYLMIKSLTSVFSMTLLVVVAFYSAEIIWRERDCRIHQIIDALPVPNWVFVTSKVVALSMIMMVIMVLGVMIAMIVQLLNGHTEIALGWYFHRGVIYPVIPFVFLAILTCFFQVLANHRYLGLLYFGLFIALIVSLSDILGINHPLLSYGFPGIVAPLSDMNGNGRFIYAGYVLRFYWFCIAGLIVIMTYLWWNRGIDQPLKYRLRAFKSINNSQFKKPIITFVIGIVLSGSYIYHNTNILNDFLSEKDSFDLRYIYEKRYGKHHQLPMPKTVAVDVDVDIFPEQRRLEVSSKHLIKNKTDLDIDTIYVTFPPSAQVLNTAINKARVSDVDETFNYYSFTLDKILKPEEIREFTFDLIIQQQGFVHAQPDLSLVKNGTFIRNNQITPHIGFNPKYRITDEKVRKAYNLPSLNRMAKLEDISQYNISAMRNDSDFIEFRSTVSTTAEQMAIAPGTLKNQWMEQGRHYFSYEMAMPMHNFYSFLSADYQQVNDQWQGVDISVYYHKDHTYNVQRMIIAVKDSLDYYSKAFGPYVSSDVKLVEFPAYRQFAQAFVGLIPYSEAMGFVADVKVDDIDMPYYVTAHEMAHQWWGHQLAAANVQGQRFLQETLAQYSALMVMEKKYGSHKIRQFLKYELDKYLSGRSEDVTGELPLNKVEKQSYIYYRKGAVIMYALRDYLGEEAINRSLKELMGLRAYSDQPYAISMDFINILKKEVSSEYHDLIEDFLEKITLYDVKFEQAQVKQLSDGRYQISMDVSVAKYYADAKGNETPKPFDIPVDIGFFTTDPNDIDYRESDVLMLKKYMIADAHSTIEIILDKKPTYAGIDPYNKLIDRNSDDNIGKVNAN